MNPDLLPGGDVRPPDGSNAANMSVCTTTTTIASTTTTTITITITAIESDWDQ